MTKLDQLNKKLQKDLIKLESSKSNQEEKLSRVPSRSKNPLQHNSINKIVKKFSTVNLDSGIQVRERKRGRGKDFETPTDSVVDGEI